MWQGGHSRTRHRGAAKGSSNLTGTVTSAAKLPSLWQTSNLSLLPTSLSFCPEIVKITHHKDPCGKGRMNTTDTLFKVL